MIVIKSYLLQLKRSQYKNKSLNVRRKKTLISLISQVFITLILLKITCIKALTSNICVGPSSPDDLAESLFGPNTDYSRRTRPNVAILKKLNISNPAKAEPDTVRLSMKVISVKSINLRRSEFEATIKFMQTWNDYRLAFNQEGEENCLPNSTAVGFSEQDGKFLWQPNVILRNAVDDIELLNSVFKIHGDGKVIFEQTYISKSSCELDLTHFPFDIQTCNMLYGSWKADIGDIRLMFSLESEPISLVRYDNVYPTAEEFNVIGGGVSQYSLEENDSLVTFSVTLERESQYYLQFVMVPVILMNIISWTSLFVDRGAAPARVTLSIICFLTISNFISNQFIALPKLPSKVWLLRFMEMSLFYAFIPVVEYVACNYLFRVERRLEIVRKTVKETKMLEVERARLDAEQGGVGCKRSSYLNSYRNVQIEVYKKDMVAFGVCKIDQLMLKRNGHMRFKDQHLDIFFRWAYPVTYIIALGVLVGLIK